MFSVCVGVVDSLLVREQGACRVEARREAACLWSMIDRQKRCSVVGQLGDSQQQYHL